MANIQQTLDIDGMKWLVDRRAKVQQRLVEIYELLDVVSKDVEKRHLIDELAATGFSLWRAVFLAETTIEWDKVSMDLKHYLHRVITDNAVGYADDKANRAWTVGYYL